MSNSYHNLTKYSFSSLIDTEEQTRNLTSSLTSYSYQTSKQGFRFYSLYAFHFPVFLPAQHRYTQLPFGGDLAPSYSYAKTKEQELEHLQMFKEPTQTRRRGESGRLRLLISKQYLGDTPCPISMPEASLPEHRPSLPMEVIFRLSGFWLETSVINQKMCGFSLISRRFSFPFLFHHFQLSTLSAHAFCWLSDCVSFFVLQPYPLTYMTFLHSNRSSFRNVPPPQQRELKVHLGNQRCLDVISL